MNIGDKLYYIKVTSNAMSRKKITMIDDTGTEWYRYDKHIQEYELETHTIIGKVTVTVEGVTDENAMVENEYHTDKIMTAYESDLNSTKYWPYWFTDMDAALKQLTKCRAYHAD